MTTALWSARTQASSPVGPNLETTFENITRFLLYLLVPSMAINLTEVGLAPPSVADWRLARARRVPDPPLMTGQS